MKSVVSLSDNFTAQELAWIAKWKEDDTVMAGFTVSPDPDRMMRYYISDKRGTQCIVTHVDAQNQGWILTGWVENSHDRNMDRRIALFRAFLSIPKSFEPPTALGQKNELRF